ncbi:hypothetical protein F5B20DRAFT_550893 [Whalleya microplaca]|nr:hypothetical protein F5B20DRAFT_550893 [Whalleya microplaca]
MSNAWFSAKLAPDGDTKDGVHPEEAQAMKNYLRIRTTANEAAHAITRPTERANNPNEDLARLWAFLGDALMEIPEIRTECLVALLQAIEDLPKPNMSHVEKQNLPAHGELWRGLPGFGHHWADMYRASDWRTSVAKAKSPSERGSLFALHSRKANVEARLAVAGLGGMTIDWGYECVADALEQEIADVAVLKFEISGAAEWLIIACDRFKEGAAKSEESWGLERRNDLWKSGKTMTPGRWSFWEGRLRTLIDRTRGNVRDRARKALERMEIPSS